MIVIASFAIFAISETKSASNTQQQQLNGEAPSKASRHSAARQAIDDAANAITSPFSSIASGSSDEWAERGVKLLLALAVYGFGLGYLARMLRVRV